MIAQLKSGKTDRIEQAQAKITADLASPKTLLTVIYETGFKQRDLDDVLGDLEKVPSPPLRGLQQSPKCACHLYEGNRMSYDRVLETISGVDQEIDISELAAGGASVARKNAR